MRLALISCRPTPTNDALADAPADGLSWEPMTPRRALEVLRPGDAALGRLDVLPTLDGMDDGLWALGALAARGVHVLNDPAALLAAHDKLLTARVLRRRDVSHPATVHVRQGRGVPQPLHPVVLKPRYGSWGREVHRCDDFVSLSEALARVRTNGWYRRHGAIVQELITPQGYDLRVLVAAGRIVGAVYRVAAEGEWRTNVALGGVRRPVLDPPREAATLALDAARAIGAALVGVDLLPDGLGGWVVAELNGAVEFTAEYAPWGDVFAETAVALAREARSRRELRAAFASPAAA
ncbi:MAG: ATP-grasp domain-containing protein [Actinomycetota bacterium]|nr:ATP-grasp domain-containing protein [Actinomycetota bacterium]